MWPLRAGDRCCYHRRLPHRPCKRRCGAGKHHGVFYAVPEPIVPWLQLQGRPAGALYPDFWNNSFLLGAFVIGAVLLGAVLLIPEAVILGESGSQGISFPSTVEWYFNLIAELGRQCIFVETYTGRDTGQTFILGVFTLF